MASDESYFNIFPSFRLRFVWKKIKKCVICFTIPKDIKVTDSLTCWGEHNHSFSSISLMILMITVCFLKRVARVVGVVVVVVANYTVDSVRMSV